jgi:hypothetical protein
MKGRVFQVLGDSSYAIYLIHVPFELVVFPYLIWQWNLHTLVDPHIGLVLLVALATAAGVAVHYFYEVPVNRAVLTALLKPLKGRPPFPPYRGGDPAEFGSSGAGAGSAPATDVTPLSHQDSTRNPASSISARSSLTSLFAVVSSLSP